MKRRAEEKPYYMIGANLKRARIYAGLSQVELGKLLGVSFQQVQKYETGANRLPAYQLFLLHRALDIPFDFFFEGIDAAEAEDIPTLREALSRRIQTIPDNKTVLKMMQLMDVLMDWPRVL